MSAMLDIGDPERIGRGAFEVRHALAGHELFSLERLVELSRRLPERSIEYNAGRVPLTLDPARTPRTGLSAEQTLRRIEECGSWMVLKNVEAAPEYAALLARCLSEVARALGEPAGASAAFVFVSSPEAVTPYHVDPEENFLLQLRGRKTIHVFDPFDRGAVSEEELERFFSGRHRNLTYRDGCASRARLFELAPGRGAHVPLAAPHWVQNGPEVSISFSVTFQTRRSVRRMHAHRFNAFLRRLGIEPRPVGRSEKADRIKQLASRAQQRALRLTMRG